MMDPYAQEIPASVRDMATQDEAAPLALFAPKSKGEKRVKTAGDSLYAPNLLPNQLRDERVSDVC
jgi:hypothetical protein